MVSKLEYKEEASRLKTKEKSSALDRSLRAVTQTHVTGTGYSTTWRRVLKIESCTGNGLVSHLSISYNFWVGNPSSPIYMVGLVQKTYLGWESGVMGGRQHRGADDGWLQLIWRSGVHIDIPCRGRNACRFPTLPNSWCIIPQCPSLSTYMSTYRERERHECRRERTILCRHWWDMM